MDWRQRPRPLGEFATGFSPAQNTAKLQARIKCNVYNFRANYFLAVLAMETLCVLCLRGLTGTLALLLGTFGIMCLNDTFAGSVRSAPGPCAWYGQFQQCLSGLRIANVSGILAPCGCARMGMAVGSSV